MEKVLVFVFTILCVIGMSFSRTKNYGMDYVAAILVDNNTKVAISCLLPLPKVSKRLTPLPSHVRPEYVELYNCNSDQPYAPLMISLNIEVTDTLSVLPPTTETLSATHFKGLAINKLRLNVPRETKGEKLVPSSDFLEPLTTLAELEVFNSYLPPLYANTNVRKVTLKNGGSFGSFGGCSELKELEIDQWNIPPMLTNWLVNCSNLKTMRLLSLPPPMIKQIIKGATTLHSLTIRKSRLQCAKNTIDPDCYRLFDGLVELESLDLSDNEIDSIHINFFEDLPSLKELNLSSNKVTETYILLGSIKLLSRLKKLTLDKNVLENWCTFFYDLGPDLSLPQSLEELSLSSTGIKNVCALQMSTNSLVKLDMTYNAVEILNFSGLPFRSKPFMIDLQHNQIRDFILTGVDYTRLKRKNINLTVKLDPVKIKCDCQHKWLARALRQYSSLKIEELSCDSGTTLDKINLSTIDCEKRNCSGCLCRDFQSGETHANCSGVALDKILQDTNLTILNLHGSGIQKLGYIPSSIMDIDLSNNRLSHVDDDVVDSLFSNPRRVVRLSGNPITCDCKNRHFISNIQGWSAQIEDYSYVRCANLQPIGNVVIADLCDLESRQTTLVAALGVSGAFGILAVVAMALSHRYRHELRVYLHAKGYCSCLFYEHNEDRPYDVFLSFSHGDVDLVVEEILPKLEKGLHEYSVCVHYRDWIAGEWIPMQIARSIQLSRRTLIIVSSSFLDSMWGILEFRTAMMCSAREGRSRIVLVLLDENLINDSRIDPDLHTYLKANTYLCWDDPWFWEKLYYALPHGRSGKKEGRSDPKFLPTNDEVNFHELQNLLPLNSLSTT